VAQCNTPAACPPTGGHTAEHRNGGRSQVIDGGPDNTGSTDTAVVRGIGRTGRLVTSAALILFLAFTALASGPETDVKVLATGLAAGILLDATVIRALLVPAVVSLFGRWNWWLPRLPARLLRVEPSLPTRTAPGEGAA
jgi:putative drug exporter of the RND superfamily